MRTTLSIDDDVLYAVKSLALRQGRSAGEVLSELARRVLCRLPPTVRQPGLRLARSMRSWPPWAWSPTVRRMCRW